MLGIIQQVIKGMTFSPKKKKQSERVKPRVEKKKQEEPSVIGDSNSIINQTNYIDSGARRIPAQTPGAAPTTTPTSSPAPTQASQPRVETETPVTVPEQDNNSNRERGQHLLIQNV